MFPCLVEFMLQGKIWSCPKTTSLSGLCFQNHEWADYIGNPHKGWETWGEYWRKWDLGGERKGEKCGSPNSSMTQRPCKPMNRRDPKPVSSQLPGKWPDLSGQNGSSQGDWLKTLGIQGLAKMSMSGLKRSKRTLPHPPTTGPYQGYSLSGLCCLMPVQIIRPPRNPNSDWDSISCSTSELETDSQILLYLIKII